MKKHNPYALAMIGILVSFAGFAIENIWRLLTKGILDNRGMLLPFLAGYGMALIAFYLLFGTPDTLHFLRWKIPLRSRWAKHLCYLLTAAVLISIGEILLGTLVEKLCHFYWWDYTNLPLNITRYTSVPTSLGFAAMVYLFMARIFSPLYNAFCRWPQKWLRILSIILSSLLLADFVNTGLLMYIKKQSPQRWKIVLFHRALQKVLSF